MSIKIMEAPELLSKNRFNIDEEEAHIVIDPALCAQCRDKPCIYVCPAVLYKLDKNGDMSFDYAGCLECGTCRVICHDIGNKGIIKWVYPRGTFGVSFRYG